VERNTSDIRTPYMIILPALLYGCETWFLTVREEHRLRVNGNRMLKRISGPKRVGGRTDKTA
jgi:hypothetical protein